jgi:hypothetical protein
MAECKDKCGARGVTWCLVAVCSFALLIWAKLRLVTGVPRTAYAVPEDKQPPAPKPELKPQVTEPSQQP